MTEQEQINYNRIAEAIDYIKANFKEQPSLNEIAERIHLSPFHFQRFLCLLSLRDELHAKLHESTTYDVILYFLSENSALCVCFEIQ